MGVGKTTFVQILARLLGVQQAVVSPTFLIMKKYPVHHNHFQFLFHIDAYRISQPDELLRLDFQQIIGDSKNIVAIEWPEHVWNILPKAIYITMRDLGDGKREIMQSYYDPKA